MWNWLSRKYQKYFASDRSGSQRPINTAQIEIVSDCNHRCWTCPGTYVKKEHRLSMPWEIYQKVARETFHQIKLIYLQGWGEPLLHPRVIDMAALAKEKGCQVGFTTNGSLFNNKIIRTLIDLEIDYITISYGGATSATHEAVRKNSNWEKLVSYTARLVKERRQSGRTKPQINISFLRTHQNIQDLPEMMKLAARVGADEVAVINPDYCATTGHEQKRLFDWKLPPSEYVDIVHKSQEIAKSLGLTARIYPLQLEEEVLECELNPQRQLFVDSNGDVSPCVYANVYGQPEFFRYFKGKKIKLKKQTFGNIKKEPLMEIWRRESYVRFREIFAKRMNSYKEAVDNALWDTNIEKIKTMEKTLDSIASNHPLPDICQTCYKAYGA